MDNKWYLQLGNVNEYKFITQPELLFCAYEVLTKTTDDDIIVHYNNHSLHSENDDKSTELNTNDGQRNNMVGNWLRSDQQFTHRYYFEPHMINIVSESYTSASLVDKKRIWRTRGLCVTAQLADERLFLVRIYDLCLLSWQRVNADLRPIQSAMHVKRDRNMQIKHDGSVLSEKTLRQVEVHAGRALYALWLDAGSALVAISGTGKIAIRDVWSLLDFHYVDDQEAISKSLNSLVSSASLKSEAKLLIGADPEFALLNEYNKIVPASTYLDIDTEAKIGADALMRRQTIIYPLVELRPSPKPLPHQLIKQIKQLLQDASQLINNHELRWVAGSMPANGLALGGHIHFSGISLTPRLLRILDGIVAMPLATIEDPMGRGRYKRYGALGDYRRQPHGGFEYRTPPSWLVSQVIAKSVISLAFIGMKYYNSLSQYFTLKDEWYIAYDEGNYELLAKASREMLDQIEKLPGYSELAHDIEPLRRAIEERRHWEERVDIRSSWNIF